MFTSNQSEFLSIFLWMHVCIIFVHFSELASFHLSRLTSLNFKTVDHYIDRKIASGEQFKFSGIHYVHQIFTRSYVSQFQSRIVSY